jgi:hypothetical protein
LSREQESKIEEGLELIKRHEGSKASIRKEIEEKRIGYQLSYAHEWCRKYGVKNIDVRVGEKKP